MRKFVSTMVMTAVLGIGTAALVSPVRAAQDDVKVILKEDASVQVMFRDNAFVKSIDDVHAALDKQVKKYTEGVQLGTTSEGLAKVDVDGTIVYASLESLATTEEAIEQLKEEKAGEERKAEETRKRAAQKSSASETAKKDAAQEKRDLEESEDEISETEFVSVDVDWAGPVLSKSAGAIQGPSGKETYYNLPMQGVVQIMRNLGNNDPYWIREDGVKMLGDYVIIAANLNLRPRGSLVPTSLGMGIVCDTGGFAHGNPTQIDIATAW